MDCQNFQLHQSRDLSSSANFYIRKSESPKFIEPWWCSWSNHRFFCNQLGDSLDWDWMCESDWYISWSTDHFGGPWFGRLECDLCNGAFSWQDLSCCLPGCDDAPQWLPTYFWCENNFPVSIISPSSSSSSCKWHWHKLQLHNLDWTSPLQNWRNWSNIFLFFFSFTAHRSQTF